MVVSISRVRSSSSTMSTCFVARGARDADGVALGQAVLTRPDRTVAGRGAQGAPRARIVPAPAAPALAKDAQRLRGVMVEGLTRFSSVFRVTEKRKKRA